MAYVPGKWTDPLHRLPGRGHYSSDQEWLVDALFDIAVFGREIGRPSNDALNHCADRIIAALKPKEGE